MKQLSGSQLAICLLVFFSTTTPALDLVKIHELAKAQDIQLKIVLNQLQSTRFSLPQAKSANRPQVNLSANTSYQDKGNSLTGDDKQNSYGYTLSLQQRLYNPETWSQVDAVEASIMQSEADYQVALQDLIVRVTGAYFDILSAQDNVDFAVAEKKAIGRQLEQAKKRFEVGLIAITDVKEAQASFDFSLSQEIIAINTLDNAREALQLIIGQILSEPLTTLGEQVDLIIPQPADRPAWVEQAQKFNLNLLSSKAALQAANENRKIARAGHKPTLDLIASYQDNEIDSDLSGDFDTDDLTLSIQFNLPLYTSGRISGAVDQAEADYATAQNNLLLQKRLIAQQTNTAYLAVVSGIGQVNALEQALISSRAALEATEAGFDVGTRTSVEVLDSLRETFRARRDYSSARYDYLLNTLRLKQSGGRLNDEDIAIVNQWLVN